MKKQTTALLTLLSLSIFAKAQTTPKPQDSVKLAKTTIGRLIDNADGIQNTLHSFHMDAILRDRLDSVYYVNRFLLDEKIHAENYKTLKPTPKTAIKDSTDKANTKPKKEKSN